MNLSERHLTKQELENREQIMKDLKHNKSGFVKRYGKDAEKVMYASATKRAKKMTEDKNKTKIKEIIKSILKPETVKENNNPVDTVTLDIPLLIRIMEYAKEDAKTDMDLHKIAEKMIAKGGKSLTMDDYNSIVDIKEENKYSDLVKEVITKLKQNG